MAEARLIPPLYPLLPHISAENLISRPSPSPIDIRPRSLPSLPRATPPAATPSLPPAPRRRRAQRAALALRHGRGRLHAWDGEEGGEGLDRGGLHSTPPASIQGHPGTLPSRSLPDARRLPPTLLRCVLLLLLQVALLCPTAIARAGPHTSRVEPRLLVEDNARAGGPPVARCRPSARRHPTRGRSPATRSGFPGVPLPPSPRSPTSPSRRPALCARHRSRRASHVTAIVVAYAIADKEYV